MTRTITKGIVGTYIFLSCSRPFALGMPASLISKRSGKCVPYTADDDVVTTACKMLEGIVHAK